MLSVHTAVNSTMITSELLLRKTDSLSGVETKNLVDEIMTRKKTSPEAMPGHCVTNNFPANTRSERQSFQC